MEDIRKCGAIIPDTFYPIERLQQYVHFGNEKSYAKGSYVIFPGEEPYKIIYILNGNLRVNLICDDGRERLLYYAGKYTFVGRLFETSNNICALAVEDSKVCTFNKQQLSHIFHQDEEVVFDIIRNYLSKVGYYMKQVTEMDYFSPAVRIVRLLYELYISKGVATDNYYEIDSTLTLKSISEITGSHYVTVSKVFSNLKKWGILEKKKSKIIVYSVEKLQSLTQETHIL